MKRILTLIGVMVMGGMLLISSPQVSLTQAADYDITGVWRLFWDDDCYEDYVFDGDYFKFVGGTTSGSWEYYYMFDCWTDSGMNYNVSGTTLTMTENNYKVVDGIFLDKNTINATYYDGDYHFCFKLERVINDQKPFGSFDLPGNGTVVSGSIPISGWALDDTMLTSLKIYYSPVASTASQSSNWQLVEDSVDFLHGARPDIEGTYPSNYYCDCAGWGYMCLTYFLPNGGNGPFMLHVVATDIAGNSTTWSVTVTGNNANRVNPFGAIDTPEQCGYASVYGDQGYKYRNWGWALTPWPNYIPIKGIGVYIDGVRKGDVKYNLYRSDIANFFPGYSNSAGAGGYFDLDLSPYPDLTRHVLFWFAIDSAGNRDGIGSRYFFVDKWAYSWAETDEKSETPVTIRCKKSKDRTLHEKDLAPYGIPIPDIPLNSTEPIAVKRGINPDTPYISVFPTGAGITRLNVEIGERIEIRVSNDKNTEITGYIVVNNNILTPLPIGSTLDQDNKTFSWIPGPGYIGEYECVFIEKKANGDVVKRKIIIDVTPGKGA